METKTRTITLTDRAPVRIREDEWPEIASARGDSYRGDPSRARQARQRGECDEYSIRVRQHEDGRAIVYAVLSAAAEAWHQPAGGIDLRAGELLEGDNVRDRIPDAIRRVGEDCGIPDHVIRECIADLPPVKL